MPEGHVNLGQALLELGRWDEADSILTKAVRLRPLDANAHNNLAVAAIQKKNWSVAEGEVREALRLAPNLP